ncbi:hypothetical protein BRADI_4g41143v3 [Brachypodium distachyon]|uniref:Myb/SANT-like domain-containing protein n=1 Tax=Brachypodium distachyon TaxID=15368 RepID=A0A0Q3EX30_BRADI|nr:hypothetical protein BRADI_4g41143v3 [Brachypodium distachyon]
MENVGQPSGSGQIVWTNSMSSMMLSFLADLVATGTRTSSGFKAMHLNNCAKALNEHFKTGITGAQISNHLKKWRKVWINVTKLRNLSGALWDEDTSTIRLADDHYANHVKHYNAMATIFGASMATGKYAKSENDPISVEVIDVEDDQNTPNESGTEVNMSPNMGESANANAGKSSHNKQPPRKKAKVEAKDEDPMLSTIKFGLERVAAALEKSAGGGDEIPEGLWDVLDGLPDFEEGHLCSLLCSSCG